MLRQDDQIRGGSNGVLRHRTVGVLTKNVIAQAHRLLTGSAVVALSAEETRIQHHPITGANIHHAFADFSHLASAITAADQREIGLGPGENLYGRPTSRPEIEAVD